MQPRCIEPELNTTNFLSFHYVYACRVSSPSLGPCQVCGKLSGPCKIKGKDKRFFCINSIKLFVDHVFNKFSSNTVTLQTCELYLYVVKVEVRGHYYCVIYMDQSG
ncbi:hypothetical protein BRADI_2g46266v3 [Brachypodium distachyon]|uniref:Uncharacterized protein n=1 Tax=Brachypodium distachyon TaxID=15368 RepID=A0A0Q3GFE1_BRADI|nr:hypothetical protein BRADI_2g46266v3 [Brachypodium distachyon]